MSDKKFLQDVLRISIPVALQSMLQSSFSMVDQIMVGQLGDKGVAAVEIAGKPINRAYLSICFQSFPESVRGNVYGRRAGNHRGQHISRDYLMDIHSAGDLQHSGDGPAMPGQINLAALYRHFFCFAQYSFKLLLYIWKFWRAASWNSRRRICECHIPGSRSTDFHPVFLQIIWADSYFVKPWKGRIFAVLSDASADCFE